MGLEWDEKSSDCAAMVAERNLSEDFLDGASGLSIGNALDQLTHVKLDRENITSIDMIRYILSLPNMTYLYLQQNGLKSLNGIEVAKGLKFLVLSDNQLIELNGLSSLLQLMVLDASDNSISKINAAELPQSLSFLSVEGNPCCTSQEDLREHLKTSLPNLKELDGDSLTDYSCSECPTESDDTEEEEDEENIKGTRRQDDLEVKVEEQAGEHLSLKTSRDIYKKLTPCGKEYKRSSPAVTPSGEECWKSRKRYALASRKGQFIEPLMPEIVERLGTPSSVVKAIGSTRLPHPDEALENALDADMIEYYQLKDSLYENNLDAEGAVQTVLSHTVGGLDYHCDMMSERTHERMKSLDVQLGKEIIRMFFSPETSPRSTSMDQEASSSGNISSSVMSPTSVDHWKYLASTSSEYSSSKQSLSLQNICTPNLSDQESLASKHDKKDEEEKV